MRTETAVPVRDGFRALDSCVHCGFCLQACPTFLATGDEADSPRGRIELMRALERGALAPDDPFVQTHLDRCLGCRGCEPVCPSGVGYGRGLEAARELLTQARPLSWVARAALAAFTMPGLSRAWYALARLLRATGLPARLAGWGRVRFAMGMLAATKPDGRRRTRDGQRRTETERDGRTRTVSVAVHPRPSQSVSLFRGCIMEGLFSHVHDATIRTLRVNGYDVREIEGQVCCGALHVHAGDRPTAEQLARRNMAAFGDGAESIVVNSAGCGAVLKDYGHLVSGGEAFGARVRDVTELLAERGPVPGAPIDARVAYDPPCHLLHAQGLADPPRKLFGAIPVLQLVSAPDAAQCCGSAGLFTLVEPEMSRAVLAPKLASLKEVGPGIVATGNPGCLMQLGAGLRAAGMRASVRHPVELLDDSYRAAGYYA